jgi:hypothetical protein
MKKLWSKIVFAVVSILSLVGIQPSAASLTPPPNQDMSAVKKNTPLYLKLGSDRIAPEGEMKTAYYYYRHYQHYSHYAHRAHWAHRAHYSHYNYYR